MEVTRAGEAGMGVDCLMGTGLRIMKKLWRWVAGMAAL